MKTSRDVLCPACGVRPGKPCRGTKRNAHAERTWAWQRILRLEKERIDRARRRSLQRTIEITIECSRRLTDSEIERLADSLRVSAVMGAIALPNAYEVSASVEVT